MGRHVHRRIVGFEADSFGINRAERCLELVPILNYEFASTLRAVHVTDDSGI
jgi:hypothetical protein